MFPPALDAQAEVARLRYGSEGGCAGARQTIEERAGMITEEQIKQLADTWYGKKTRHLVSHYGAAESVVDAAIDTIECLIDSWREQQEPKALESKSHQLIVCSLLEVLSEQDAEIERLKGALQKIATGHNTKSGDLLGATWRELELVQIARRAIDSD